MGSLDLPDELGPDELGPDELGPDERAPDGGVGRPRPPELPDPDERARVYEAMRAYVSAETRKQPKLGSEAAGRADGADRRGSAETEARRLR